MSPSDRENISRWLSAYFIAISYGESVSDVLRSVGIDVPKDCGNCWVDRSKWELARDRNGEYFVCKKCGKFIGYAKADIGRTRETRLWSSIASRSKSSTTS